MTEEQAREILLKQFDKSCGNYSYQNAHKIDLEQALFIGAKALERQMPKKPKGETDPMFGDVKTVCPSCGNANLVNPFVRSRVYDYCPNCGQALDWSE